ncbi:MAG TPA: glutaminyl-peptide cyclotransferase [Calditrichia bacterium]|nr:glutaminyl-peptide cyclotransferase [Calditrichia bacterium]
MHLKIFLFLWLLFGTALGLAQGEQAAIAPVYDFEIVNVFPHDPNAYTQGLVYQEGILWEGTGQRGASTLRKVDLHSGAVLEYVDLLPDYFGEGIVLFDGRIYQLTWQSQIGFVYDPTSLMQIEEFFYAREGWGLTTDGQYLIASDGTASLYFIDPYSFDEIRTLEVHDHRGKVNQLNELEYINGEIFANIYPTDKIARISPETGEVLAWIDLSGLLPASDYTRYTEVLNGIAFDSKRGRLFVTGKNWPKLFEIELIERGN